MTESASNPKKTLAEMQNAWNLAAKVWNPKALAKLYADNALFYGGRSGHSVGVAAIQPTLHPMMASFSRQYST